MPPRTVDILVSTLRTGDATSTHTFALIDVLRSRGMTVRVYHNHPSGTLPAEIQPLVQQADFAGYTPGADLTILQYPIWFPLAERFRQAPRAAIFWYHGVTPPALWGDRPGRELLEISQMRTDLAWRAHVAVSASPFTAEELHRHSGCPRARLRVVPLTVDVDGLAQRPVPATLDMLRRELGIQQQRVLLYVGRIAGNKGIDLLIRGLAHLARTDVRLLVVGDYAFSNMSRDLHDELQTLAQQLGVAGRVTFTGRVPDVTPYFHLADVCLLPSRHEGFGVPIAEAMAVGIPAIAARAGALPWVLGEPEADAAGLLFAPDDVDELARQITRVLDDPALAARLVERGRQRVRQFDRAHFEHNVQQIVEEAWQLGGQGGASAMPANPFSEDADIALRDYVVRSHIPLVGPLLVWLRRNLTSHVKEPYLDRIIERQVNYNRRLAQDYSDFKAEMLAVNHDLQREIDQLREQIAALRSELHNRPPSDPTGDPS